MIVHSIHLILVHEYQKENPSVDGRRLLVEGHRSLLRDLTVFVTQGTCLSSWNREHVLLIR